MLGGVIGKFDDVLFYQAGLYASSPAGVHTDGRAATPVGTCRGCRGRREEVLRHIPGKVACL